MESVTIKAVVAKVHQLIATGDRSFSEPPSAHLASAILLDLSRHFGKSPTMAVAIVQYIADVGFDFSKLNRGQAYKEFANTFGKRMSQLNDAQREQVKNIGVSLFSQMENRP